MLFEAEILVSSLALQALDPEGDALSRLAEFFGFTSRLAAERRRRLAAALGGVLVALERSGVSDAIYATRDGQACFVDPHGTPDDLAELVPASTTDSIDFDALRVCVRDSRPTVVRNGGDPYRTSNSDEAPAYRLHADVQLYRTIPDDGYPLRIRVHGLIRELESRPEDTWSTLTDRVRAYIETHHPTRRINGVEDVPTSFRDLIAALAGELKSVFASMEIDTAYRAAVVIPRYARMALLPPLPYEAAAFARIPGMQHPLRYLFAWPEVHAGLEYAQTLFLDDAGRRLFALGFTPATAGNPTGFLMPEVPQVTVPVSDALVFSGHHWDSEARDTGLLGPTELRGGLEGSTALFLHERRKFQCGSSPATSSGLGMSSPGSIRIVSSDGIGGFF